jgi:probable HAF family extracellular repeat protein
MGAHPVIWAIWGGQSVANDINSNGVVVGKSKQSSGRWRAFSYSNGAIHDLGGSTNSLIWEEAALAINFWGDVVGVESVQEPLSPTGGDIKTVRPL